MITSEGLGDYVCDESGCYDNGQNSTPIYPTSMACTCVAGTCLENGNSCSSGGSGTPVYTPSGSSSQPFNWASFASSFSNIFKAIQPLPSGCTQVAGPYGTSTQCLQGGQPSTLNLTGGLTSSSLTSMLPLLGIGLVVFLVARK